MIDLDLILLSVTLSTLNTSLPLLKKLFSFITALLYPVSSEKSSTLAKEIKTKTIEMHSMDKLNELANYIRMNRQIEKMRDELKGMAKDINQKRKTAETALYFVCYITSMVLSVVAFWWNRNKAVVIAPEEWLNPFHYLFSWPSCIPGEISYPVWFLISNTVTRHTIGGLMST